MKHDCVALECMSVSLARLVCVCVSGEGREVPKVTAHENGVKQFIDFSVFAQ